MKLPFILIFLATFSFVGHADEMTQERRCQILKEAYQFVAEQKEQAVEVDTTSPEFIWLAGSFKTVVRDLYEDESRNLFSQRKALIIKCLEEANLPVGPLKNLKYSPLNSYEHPGNIINEYFQELIEVSVGVPTEEEMVETMSKSAALKQIIFLMENI